MIFLPSPIPVRYALIDGPFAGRTICMGISEEIAIEVENGDRFEKYVLVPGMAAYRWECSG